MMVIQGPGTDQRSSHPSRQGRPDDDYKHMRVDREHYSAMDVGSGSRSSWPVYHCSDCTAIETINSFVVVYRLDCILESSDCA